VVPASVRPDRSVGPPWDVDGEVTVGRDAKLDCDPRRIEGTAPRVYQSPLHVRVAKDWQRDPKQLRKLGF